MMLEIDGWKVGLRFSASHFIPHHGKCSRLHGHDYGVRIRIFGEVRDGMLFDFVELKRIVRNICEEMDHRVIVPTMGEEIHHEIKGENVAVEMEGKRYSFPKGDVYFAEIDIASAENLAKHIARRVIEEIKFPENVKGVEICVDEGPGQGACEYIALGD